MVWESLWHWERTRGSLCSRFEFTLLLRFVAHVFFQAKDPSKVTLAEHTRLYKLRSLLETLSLSCEFQNKMVQWYSSSQGNFSQHFSQSLKKTLDDMEKVRQPISVTKFCLVGTFFNFQLP